jgi:raffinose/stachyose/melibiose transport system permease protein
VRVHHRRSERIAANTFLLAATLSSVLPLLLVAMNAFKSHIAIVENPLSLPSSFDFTNFVAAWKDGHFGIGLTNSVMLTGTTVLITTGLASPASFPLARRRIAGWRIISLYFLTATTVPVQMFLFPLFFVYARLGLVGNPFATALVLAAVNLPLAIFLLRTYVMTIPVEIDEAAEMDGATPWQIFWNIILPLIRPGLVTVGIVVGLNAWNEFLITSTFQPGQQNFTMTLGYLSMNNTFSGNQGVMMAGALLVIAPVIGFFLLLQRFFVEGLAMGAVKG